MTKQVLIFIKFTSSCSKYSSSASTMLKTKLFLFLILSACGDFMYSSTICFHRRLHSQPRKKLWTFLIFRSSIESSTDSHNPARFAVSLGTTLSVFCSFGTEAAAALKLPRPTGVAENEERDVSLRKTHIWKTFPLTRGPNELNINNSNNLCPKFPYLRCKLFTLLCVLPFSCFFALNNLK